MINLSRLFGYKASRSRPVSIPVRISPATTCEQRMPAITFASFRLFPFRSPLLRKSLFGFFSISYLDGSVLLVRVRFATDDWILLQPGSPIRKSPDQSLFATPRSISLLTTSFIAFPCQVIHHKPLVAWPHKSFNKKIIMRFITISPKYVIPVKRICTPSLFLGFRYHYHNMSKNSTTG